jgi:hypothetical protein
VVVYLVYFVFVVSGLFLLLFGFECLFFSCNFSVW